MSYLILRESAARSAQSDLHRVSSGIDLDLRGDVPDTRSARVQESREAWMVWLAQSTGTLSNRLWAAGDEARRATNALTDADHQAAASL